MIRSRKRKNNHRDIDKYVSFQPFSALLEQMEDEPKTWPQMPDEPEFLKKIPIQFYEHQIQAMRWMYDIEKTYNPVNGKHVGGILGDVMGLGKTVDCLGLIYYDIFRATKTDPLKSPERPTLIVATLTLLDHWKTEALNHLKLKEDAVLEYRGTSRFEILKKRIKTGNMPLIVVTTYNTIQTEFGKQETSPIYSINWERVILDEAQITRNPKTKTFKAVKHFQTRSVWAVTGTPIVNYKTDFRVLAIISNRARPLDYTSTVQELEWKKRYLLRRTKEMLNIPPMTYKEFWLDMTPAEAENYRKLEEWAQTEYDELVKSEMLTQEYQKILLVIVRLRQECICYLLRYGHKLTSKILEITKQKLGMASTQSILDIDDDAEGLEDVCFVDTPEEECIDISLDEPSPKRNKMESSSGRVTSSSGRVISSSVQQIPNDIPVIKESEVDDNFTYSSKMLFLLNLLEKIKVEDRNGKTVVFSQFTTMLDLTECMLLKHGYKVARFDGRQQKSSIRKQVIHMFRTDIQCTVLLISLKAGGVGLNLLPARHLVLMDPWWNGSVEHQAFDRVHRIGQTHAVTVYKPLMSRTIEEQVIETQKKKQAQQASFFGDGKTQMLSIGDIHSVFSTMKTRHQKMMRLINSVD